MNGDDPQYWYCLKHGMVEPREGCKNADRLGPYATQSAATRALELVAERNEAWDNDPVWNDEDEPDDEDESGPAS